ncbi:CsbD family protein [Chloroflexota bacterium]
MSSRWTRFSRDVKKKWGKLTDEEVMQVNGRREILVGKIQEKYSIGMEETHQQIEEWVAKLKM